MNAVRDVGRGAHEADGDNRPEVVSKPKRAGIDGPRVTGKTLRRRLRGLPRRVIKVAP